MSRPPKSAVAASSTVICSSPHGKVVPALRADAKYRTRSSGKLRCASSAHDATDLSSGSEDSDIHAH